MEQTRRLIRSLLKFAQINLYPDWQKLPPRDLARQIFDDPNFVLVSHGTQIDPVLNYGNRQALNLWEMPWGKFTKTESKKTAEEVNRQERAAALARVTRDGFTDDYSGVRIAASGKQFKIHRALIWNVLGPDEQPAGQAAMFRDWEYLDT